jgi:hypothetical protein
MKRSIIAVAVLAAFAMSASEAAPSFSQDGVITAPNPASKVSGGLTEALNPCGTPDRDLREVHGGNFNGADGWWIKLPSGAPGKAATLTYVLVPSPASAAIAVDMDVWFYTANCSLITSEQDDNAFSMATLPPTTEDKDGNPTLRTLEAGTIPAGAAFAIVDFVAGGNNAPFTFSIA